MKPLPSYLNASPVRARPVVLALHCSGATGRQWRHLARELAADYEVLAPNLIGAPGGSPWSGERAFSLSADVQSVVDMIDAAEAPTHLVGHSFGGAVALKAALLRPGQLASLGLYEPTAFHLAITNGDEGRTLASDVRHVAQTMEEAVLAGSYVRAAELFVDFWGGAGVFAGLRPEEQSAIAQFAPKACLDFRALFAERTPTALYRRISAPTLILQGAQAKPITAHIAGRLAQIIPAARLRPIPGAGHMGPVSQPDAVARVLAQHIRSASTPTGFGMTGVNYAPPVREVA